MRDPEDYIRRSASELNNSRIDCPYCGREHRIPFDEIQVGEGVIADIPAIAQRVLGFKPQKIALIYDKHIEEIITGDVVQPIEAQGIRLERYALGKAGHLLEPTVELGDQTAGKVDSDIPLILGAGSGVICDLTKWVADRVGVPCILCGTAVSMNAYTSVTATMTDGGVKVSKYLRPARAIVMDTAVLSRAPLEMTQAGLGDLAARAICNADWKLSQLLKDTYFCRLPYDLTADHEKHNFSVAGDLARSRPNAVHTLAESTLISGYSMTMLAGETSPSSGAEHVLSHFWDLQVKTRGAKVNLHGAQVAVGTLISMSVFEHVRKFPVSDWDVAQLVRFRPPLDEIVTENVERFGSVGESFNAVVRDKWLSEESYEKYLTQIHSDWERIWAEVGAYITPMDEMRGALLSAGSPTTLAEIHRTEADAIEAMLFGNRYRRRFTILDLAWELGIFPGSVEQILRDAKVCS